MLHIVKRPMSLVQGSASQIDVSYHFENEVSYGDAGKTDTRSTYSEIFRYFAGTI